MMMAIYWMLLLKLKFAPLEFETSAIIKFNEGKLALKFAPLEFETVFLMLFCYYNI